MFLLFNTSIEGEEDEGKKKDKVSSHQSCKVPKIHQGRNLKSICIIIIIIARPTPLHTPHQPPSS